MAPRPMVKRFPMRCGCRVVVRWRRNGIHDEIAFRRDVACDTPHPFTKQVAKDLIHRARSYR